MISSGSSNSCKRVSDTCRGVTEALTSGASATHSGSFNSSHRPPAGDQAGYGNWGTYSPSLPGVVLGSGQSPSPTLAHQPLSSAKDHLGPAACLLIPPNPVCDVLSRVFAFRRPFVVQFRIATATSLPTQHSPVLPPADKIERPATRADTRDSLPPDLRHLRHPAVPSTATVDSSTAAWRRRREPILS